MSKSHFTVAYDGPALRDGVMDVRDLAPALLSIGQLFDAANSSLNGDAARVSVHVVATQVGSFEISLEVVQSLSAQITGLLAGEKVTAAANLVGLVTGAGVPAGCGLIWLIKRLRGGVPDRIERGPETCTLVFEGNTFVVPSEVVHLYQDVPVRRSIRSMIAPLSRDGITEFSIREGGVTMLPIGTGDISSFDEPEILDELLLEHVIQDVFTIVSLAFKEDNKWRLNDGNATISALIEDEEFLRKVDENLVAFAKGDILICEVRVRKSRSRDTIRTDYAVQRIIEHRPAARQLPLEFE